MKVILDVYHPAQVHQFKYIVKRLLKEGHDVKILAIKKDVTTNLLDAYNLPYELTLKSSGSSTLEKAFLLILLFIKIFIVSCKYHPDIYIGRPNPASALNAFIFKKPHITYDNDDIEAKKYLNLFCSKLLSTVIITPDPFSHDYGKRHIKVPSFKELFYLHPDVYSPDETILSKYNLVKNNYIVVRFVGWKAYHDVGMHGITDKVGLVNELAKRMGVIIVSEGEINESLQKYMMKAPPEVFHDVLANAAIVISDSQTVTIESAMLGVPTIRCNSWIGDRDMSDQKTLCEKYHLTYNIKNELEILTLVDKILNTPNFMKIWSDKRDIMLSENQNMTEYFYSYISKVMGGKMKL